MRQTIRFFTVVFAMMLAWQVSLAQRTITGTVKDSKGEEIIGIAWARIVFPTRIHTWTIQHRCEPNSLERPVELKSSANKSARVILLHQVGPSLLESCQ